MPEERHLYEEERTLPLKKIICYCINIIWFKAEGFPDAGAASIFSDNIELNVKSKRKFVPVLN
jgi:hypothetical protein